MMPSIRETAAAQAQEGRIAVTQGGRAVDPGAARGPIRLSLPPG
jgi:hypothetical protein